MSSAARVSPKRAFADLRRVSEVEDLDGGEHHALLADDAVGRASRPGAQLRVTVGQGDDRRHPEGPADPGLVLGLREQAEAIDDKLPCPRRVAGLDEAEVLVPVRLQASVAGLLRKCQALLVRLSGRRPTRSPRRALS